MEANLKAHKNNEMRTSLIENGQMAKNRQRNHSYGGISRSTHPNGSLVFSTKSQVNMKKNLKLI